MALVPKLKQPERKCERVIALTFLLNITASLLLFNVIYSSNSNRIVILTVAFILRSELGWLFQVVTKANIIYSAVFLHQSVWNISFHLHVCHLNINIHSQLIISAARKPREKSLLWLKWSPQTFCPLVSEMFLFNLLSFIQSDSTWNCIVHIFLSNRR